MTQHCEVGMVTYHRGICRGLTFNSKRSSADEAEFIEVVLTEHPPTSLLLYRQRDW